MRFLGKAEFGASTFCASCYGNEQCGPNGLPLTPNSIRILGRFQKLKTIEHPRLCKYLDLVRGKHERVIVVSEHYKDNLSKKIAEKEFNSSSIIQTAFKILAGLSHLNKEGFVHRCLSPSCILFDPMDQVKLSNFGLYHMTGHGMDVSFPIGVVKYLAPEVVCQEMSSETSSSLEGSTTSIGSDSYMSKHSSSPKVDVWSLGIILLELVLKQQIWQRLSVREIFSRIIGFVQKSDVHPFDSIVKEHNGEQTIASIPTELKMLIQMCLTVMPSARPVPKDLLQHQIFSSARCSEADGALCNGLSNGFKIFSTEVQCRNLQLPSTDDAGYFDDETFDPLSERSIDEVYYLWKLAGGDVESLLRKAGRFLRRPPITTISSFVLDDGEQFGVVRDSSTLLDSTVLILSQDQLRQRLKDIEPAAYYPLLEDESTAGTNTGLTSSVSSADLVDCVKLPLVIRERDIEYQFHRIILFERLLKAYPYKRQQILKECRVDIPPLFRAHLWAAILDIEGDVQGQYEAIDKESPIPTDRQIEVDIPRCHQYSELLSSPTGHMKFKRLLKAWVVSHPEYVYWQGLDSLCAPFLYLNFNDEAISFACLSAFIPKYLHNFFLKDNACVIQEYLAVFSHLIAFHDPVLCNHLDSIGFIPDLYSIPWFLTMYAHVFPLHKIFHLWDTLLLGNSSFPLCIGVAILQQLRDQLLSFGFNECILLFSDMPEIDIEKCVQESIKIFCSTPKSATYRQHAISVKQPSSKQPKPVFSYYSQDYHETPKTHLSMEPISVDELKSEKFPRISAEDLIELSELMGPTAGLSPTKRAKSAKPVIVVADVRSEDEFKRGAIPRSINIPFNSAFGPEGELNPCPAVSFLNQNRNSIKVVVGGSRGKNASNFADALVRFGYSKVCLLHKGIDVLRSAGVLSIPTPEL